MKIARPIRGERGSILVITALSLVALVGFVGLALDLGHLYVVKTELQNAADAAALAAAEMMDKSTDSLIKARTAAMAVPNKFNFQKQDVSIASTNVTFSAQLSGPYVGAEAAAPAATRFVRVAISPQAIDLWFAPVLEILSAQVPAMAVAGPSSALQEACDLIPLAVCEDTTRCNFADPSCPDPEFVPGDLYTVKLPPAGFNEASPGNYLVLDFGGSGFADVRKWIAGGYTGCEELGDGITTQPGQGAGPVSQGFNTRFGEYKGGLSEADYSHDTDVSAPISYSAYTNGADNPHGDGEFGRRVLAVPLVDCTNWDGGKNPVTITDLGCFFLQDKVPGNMADKAELKLEFIEKCDLPDGVPSVEDKPGPIIIQLYR